MLQIDKPVVVARSGDALLLMAAGGNPTDMGTFGQLWSPDGGYSELRPLQVHLKFLYYVEVVDPPQPWQETEQTV